MSLALHGTTASAPEGFAGATVSVPPITGQCLIAAKTMSGNHMSMPYLALPSTFAGMSKRCWRVPMMRNLAGSVRRRSAGGERAAASMVSAP